MKQEGYTVDVDKSVKKIKNFMNKKWNYEDAEVELKLDMEKPTIKKADRLATSQNPNELFRFLKPVNAS